MKKNSFTKYIPISEEDYHKFREAQNQQAKLSNDELTRPVALNHLVQVQDEKTHELLAPTDLPADVVEKRLIELRLKINNLQRQVENQGPSQPLKPTTHLEEPPLNVNLGNITSIRGRAKALKVLDSLGPSAWNAAGQLVVDGKPIPQSNREELMDYAVTDWTSKYALRPPVGTNYLHKLLLDKAIPSVLLNTNVRSSVYRDARPSAGTSSAVLGYAPVARKRTSTDSPTTPTADSIFGDKKNFDTLMRRKNPKHTPKKLQKK